MSGTTGTLVPLRTARFIAQTFTSIRNRQDQGARIPSFMSRRESRPKTPADGRSVRDTGAGHCRGNMTGLKAAGFILLGFTICALGCVCALLLIWFDVGDSAQVAAPGRL